jgi:hypothetical protein
MGNTNFKKSIFLMERFPLRILIGLEKSLNSTPNKVKIVLVNS